MTLKYCNKGKRNYYRMSCFYDLFSSRAESELFHHAMILLKQRKMKNLLDIGCGTGKGLVELKDFYPSEVSSVGSDLSYKICNKAAQQKLRIINADALDLPFKASIFDAVIFNFSIEINPDNAGRADS